MVNRLGSLYRDASHPWYISVAKSLGILSACVGVVAALWHMTWIARVVVMVGGILGLAAQAAFYSRLARALGFSSAEHEKLPDNPSARCRSHRRCHSRLNGGRPPSAVWGRRQL